MDTARTENNIRTDNGAAKLLSRLLCTLTTHENLTDGEVVVHPDLCRNYSLIAGDVLHVVRADRELSVLSEFQKNRDHHIKPSSGGYTEQHALNLSRGYIGTLKVTDTKYFASKNTFHVSLSRSTAKGLALRNNDQVWLSKLEQPREASHVEITFKDEHITRGDMWRMLAFELAGKTVYKGQKITFLGTVKAHIRTVFLGGEKVQSASFTNTTKPIFRSESARFTILIQMSKEMWDFDADGSGEIMSSRVLNGFLPELFRRWQQLNVNHCVTIVLFTRMEHIVDVSNKSPFVQASTQFKRQDSQIYTDFYRVVVSSRQSKDFSAMLSCLKQEFKIFLRDVSTCICKADSITLLGSSADETGDDTEISLVRGSPSVAVRSNVLEAINLALCQHFEDRIHHDLRRTGVSIVVISPGTGLYQVNKSALVATTNRLIEQGVSIDLVCLSRMPLHSVPLFMFLEEADGQRGHSIPSHWSYSMPHWIDVSYWTTPAEEDRNQAAVLGKMTSLTPVRVQEKPFRPRVKMHELQMMGFMENAVERMCLPRLSFSHIGEPDGASQPPFLSSPGTPHTTSHGLAIRPRDSARPANQDGSIVGTITNHASLKVEQPPRGLAYQVELYDQSVFRHDRINLAQDGTEPSATHLDLDQSSGRTQSQNAGKSAQGFAHINGNPLSIKTKSLDTDLARTNSKSHGEAAPPKANRTSHKPSGILRKISLAPWSAGTTKAVASTRIDSEPGRATISTKHCRAALSNKSIQPSEATTREGWSLNSAAQFITSRDEVYSEVRSKPIAIQSKSIIKSKNSIAPRLPQDDRLLENTHGDLNVGQAKNRHGTAETQDYTPAVDHLASWLTILNPSNPSMEKTKNLHSISSLGRWQHVFPRPLRTSKMKWKSLCSPAMVPLTTASFPGVEHLEQMCTKNDYHIVSRSATGTEHTASRVLLHEMVALRICQGYQFITPNKTEKTAGPKGGLVHELSQTGPTWLFEGCNLHCLEIIDESMAHVFTYTRDLQVVEQKIPDATVRIRTVLSPTYKTFERNILYRGQVIDWKAVDQFIADQAFQNHRKPLQNEIPMASVRFVLLPSISAYPPTSPQRLVEGDNEEEARIEGIRALTQDWLLHRFLPPGDKPLQVLGSRKKDQNPFEIIYQTRNPSEIIATELKNVAEVEVGAMPVQLLPESELYSRNNIDLTAFSRTLQSERGVPMRDRRWHLRLHRSSFVGAEMTTWLVENFRDLETREEAVGLGNELMRNGLFEHVQQRHKFRDGNYFYCITGHYRTSRPISRGNWFGSLRPSIPSTAVKESRATGAPTMVTNTKDTNDAHLGTTSSENRHDMMLSKSLLYNVDHRQKSYRPEIIKLHYDRLHNPDNCYHIQIDWLAVTPKLIADAVDRWASIVSRYGLRLIEVPINEASATSDSHPFREPHVIKLAKRPPESYLSRDISPNDIGGWPSPSDERLPYRDGFTVLSRHFFQKSLLKRFAFILDFEAASAFPSTANVTYSWGAPSHRLPQYVHQSGTLIAQITEDGDFLLLTNHLYHERTHTAETAEQEPPLENLPPHVLFAESGRKASLVDQWSHGGGGSPLTSPRFGAQERSGPGCIVSTEAMGAGFGEAAEIAETAPGIERRVKEEFEQFCEDVARLDEFYKQAREEDGFAHNPSGESINDEEF